MNSPSAESQEHHRSGFQLLTENSYQEARDQFLMAIEKDPDWAPPYLGLGQTFFFQDSPDLNEAMKSFLRVVELKPDWVEGYHWLGAAQEKSGAMDKAIESFREATRMAPSDTRPLISLGVCLTHLNQFVEAIACLRRAIDLNPPYAVASAHLFLAEALRADDQMEAACKEWRLVLDLPPEYPEHNSAKVEAAKKLKEHCRSAPRQERQR